MSSERPPRGRPRPRPKGFDDVPVLSDEEVERRVDVRGGGTPRGPAERPVRASRQPRPPERTVARDSILLIGLVIVGLVAVRLLLPEGPLTGSPTQSPGGSLVVVGSVAPSTSGPTRTPGLVTLEPVVTPSPGASAEPSATPAPTPTLKPGETPKPTPKVTAAPTPGPTAIATATVVVDLHVVNDDGGASASGAWTASVASGGSASPSSFAASDSGTIVTVTAGKSYQVSVTAGPAGYSTSFGPGCSSGTGGLLAAGASSTCQIIKNDVKPNLTVITNVVGGGPQSPGDWSVAVTGTQVEPAGSQPGSSSGVAFQLNAGSSFSVGQSNSSAQDYDQAVTGTCSGSALSPGANVTCTFTFTYNPPPSDPPPAPTAAFALVAVTPGTRRRRWWTTLPGR